MAILIDGYNLLHVTGIVGRGIGPGTLERARRALLNFLAAALGDEQRARTTVVFDAQDAPLGRPREFNHQQIHVQFAAHHESADALIEELIRQDSAPRTLVVVSCDHRIQRAARRRRATAVDSDVWYDTLLRSRHRDDVPSATATFKPQTPLAEHEVQQWLDEFGDASDALLEQPADQGKPGGQDAATGSPPSEATSAKPGVEFVGDIENPFPPGYAEDLLEDDE